MDPLPPLPTGFTARPAGVADAEEIVDLFNDYSLVAFGFRKVSLDDLRSMFTAPGFDPANSTQTVLAPAGQIVGLVAVMDVASPPVHPQVLGCVHPEHERQGIGSYLLRWAEQRGQQAVERVPAGARVSLQCGASSTHEPTLRLLQKLDWTLIRYSWLMMIDLDQPPPEPRWPAGIVVRTYQDLPDLRAVYRAVDESFQDHWGHVQRSEEETLKRFEYAIANDPHFDPAVWFLAMDGDEIAGVSLCATSFATDESTGFVNQLGVRRPWRRLGLALALLYHTFGEFYRRGKKRVGLGVDAGSLTGATRLYEKAGMRAVQQLALYEKELRPGEELGRQSLQAE